MDFGKYKRALRASTRPSRLRTVVYDPSITDTDVDFPDIENPRKFAGGGAVKIIKRILSPDGLRRLAKSEGISEKDVEKFLSGEYATLKRDQARGLVKRDKDGNIVVKDKYSEKYDPLRRQMLEDDARMFDDMFEKMFSEYQYDMYKKSGRKPNSEGGVVEREAFGRGTEPPPEGSEEFLKQYLKKRKIKSWEKMGPQKRNSFSKTIFPRYQKQQEQIKNKISASELADKLGIKLSQLKESRKIKRNRKGQQVTSPLGDKIKELLGEPLKFTYIAGTPKGEGMGGSSVFYNPPTEEQIAILKQYVGKPNQSNIIQRDILQRMKTLTSGKKGEKFLNILRTNDLSDLKTLRNIQKIFPNYSYDKIGTAVTRIAQVMDGQQFRATEFIEPDRQTASKIFTEIQNAQFGNPLRAAGYQVALKELDKKLKGKDSLNFKTYRTYINRELKKMGIDPTKFNVDEYFGVSMGGLKEGFAPYSVFSRAMQSDINSKNLANFQGVFSRYIDMIDSQPNKKAKFKEIDRINKIINAREKEFGIELPKFYKGTAEQAFGKKRFKKLTEQGLDFTTDRDYAIKMPKGAMTQKELLTGLQNKDANVLLQATKDASSAKIENLNVKDEIAKKLRKDTKLLNAVKEKYKTRCKLQEGEDAAACMARNLLEDSEKLKTGNATQRMVVGNRFKDILRKGRRAGQSVLSAAALPLEIGLEGLFIGWDMAVNGVPLDEAVNRNTIVISGATELLPEGKLKESLGGGLISGPSAERLAIEKATTGNPAAQRYDEAKQALDEYNSLKGQVEQYRTAGEDSLAYQEALQKFNDLEQDLTFLGDMDEYKRILTPGSYESNEYKRVMTEQASERTGQAYRDRELGMNEGLVDPAGVEQARAEEFKDQTEVIYADDQTEEDFMNQYRDQFYKFFGEQLNKPGLQPGQSKFADNVIDMQLRNQYKQGLELFSGVRRQQYAGGGLTRRAFLKLVASVGALGVGLKSGLVKLKTTVAKQTLNNAPKGTPDWFAPLVDKIKIEGKDMTDTMSTIEREVVTVLDIPVKDKAGNPVLNYDKSPVKDSYTLRENSDTGEVVVSVNSDAGVNGEAVDFAMTPDKISDTTDAGKPIVEPGEFVVIEERAVGRQVGPDDYDIDLDEYVTNDLNDAASDWHSVEEFATGKTDKDAQVKKVQRKKMIEDDPTEDVVSRQGELMDYNQGDDDYYD